MITANITVRNLEQAWLGIMREIMDRGREYRKDDSTRAGMLRKSPDWMSVTITHPEERPLVPLPKPGLVSTCSEEDAERYLNDYLYNNEKPAPGEHYTYAQWLMAGMDYTIKRYAEGGLYTQKAIMSVGQVADDMWKCTHGQSIPCLRSIDTRIINLDGIDRLHYYIMFRAWNWFGAMPLEMAGFQMLKEIHCVLISEVASKEVLPGPTVAFCKDAHVNQIEFEAANAWLGK
jgi:thymidylate synthase